MQRHSPKNYYEDLSPRELENKLAQILWYARPGPKKPWHRVGRSEKAVYRRTAALVISEIKLRVEGTRVQLAREKWEATHNTTLINPNRDQLEYQEEVEDKILGIKGHKQ